MALATEELLEWGDPVMSSPIVSARLSHRARLVGALLAIGLIAGLVVVAAGGGRSASADTVNSDVLAACTSPIGNQNVTIPAVVTDTPDPVEAGEQMTISYRTDYPGNVTTGFNIQMAEATWPMPDEVVSIDDVTFTELGTFTAQTPVIDSGAMTVTVQFTGGGTGRPPTPITHVLVTIDDSATGDIDWEVFTQTRSTASGVPILGTVNSTCTPRDTSVGQILNTTEIEAPATTTTSTTSTSTTTTTAPPGPETCTQVSNHDGWTKTIWLVGPGGFSQSSGNSTKMYTTDDGLNRFRSAVKFPGVGGACEEGGTLPADVTVTDATVRLTKTQNCICNGPVQRLHKITQSWSESNLHANNGPSVNSTASAEFSTPGLNNAADVSNAQIIADVQDFVDTPSSNQGWSLRQRYNGSGDTGNNATPAGWATREDSTSSKRPRLVITYTS
jgi:hypothetical protein